MSKLPSVRHACPRELSHALRDYAKPDFGDKIALVPYRRYQPDESTWWICPRHEVPAYRFGKFVVKRSRFGDSLFAGISFEKGIGPSAADFFRVTELGKSWIMKSDWIWHDFIAALRDGTFDRYLTDAESVAGQPVNLVVNAGLMRPPEPRRRKEKDDADEGAESLPQQKVHYTVHESRLTAVEEIPGPDRLLPAALGCRSPADLARQIDGIKQVDWTWITVEVGFLLAAGAPTKPEWLTETVWANACEPFLDWFRG